MDCVIRQSVAFFFLFDELSLGTVLEDSKGHETHFIPIPPATNITFFRSSMSMLLAGGHTKSPPTRTLRSLPKISEEGRQNHAAGGLRGDF